MRYSVFKLIRTELGATQFMTPSQKQITAKFFQILQPNLTLW